MTRDRIGDGRSRTDRRRETAEGGAVRRAACDRRGRPNEQRAQHPAPSEMKGLMQQLVVAAALGTIVLPFAAAEAGDCTALDCEYRSIKLRALFVAPSGVK